jgi:predicted metalloendopeptidase
MPKSLFARAPFAFIVALSLVLPATGASQDLSPPVLTASTTDSGGTSSADAKLKLARFSPDKMDRSVDPRTDFGKFAAGTWYASTQIPSDKRRWGGFDELAEANWARIRGIVEEAAREPGAVGSVRQKVGDFLRPQLIRKGAMSSA